MKKQDGETSRNRRNFLKAASGAAVAFAAVKDTFAQSAGSKSAPQKDRGQNRAAGPRPMDHVVRPADGGPRRVFFLAARDVSPRPA